MNESPEMDLKNLFLMFFICHFDLMLIMAHLTGCGCILIEIIYIYIFIYISVSILLISCRYVLNTKKRER